MPQPLNVQISALKKLISSPDYKGDKNTLHSKLQELSADAPEAKTGIEINPAHKGMFTEFAKRHGMGVQEAAKHVLANKDNYSAHVVKMANFAHNFNGKKAQYGEDIPVNPGSQNVKNPLVMAEAGEVYQQPDGDVIKISDHADRHEDASGGVPLNNVQRVLEDTSTTRKDKYSKMLRIAPDEFNAMFGVDTKKSLSHSEALEKADAYFQSKTNKMNKKLQQTLDTLDENPNNFYAKNTIDLNAKTIQTVPDREQLFGDLFNHQEAVKNAAGITNDASKGKYGKYVLKADYGINIDYDPVTLNKDKGRGITPTGKSNFPTFNVDQINHYAKQLGLRTDNNQVFQKDLYDYLQNRVPNGQKIIDEMWNSYGNTNKGIQEKQNQNINAFADNKIGARTMFALDAALNGRIPEQTAPVGNPDVQYPNVDKALPSFNQPAPDVTVDDNTTAPVTNTQKFTPKKFDEPLHWYDIASDAMALTDNERIPANYNPVELNQVRLKLLNPQPALEQGNRDYNAALSYLPSNGTGMANATNIFAQKYGIDNQILGQYENSNVGVRNQEEMYNAQVKDRQSQVNSQSRATFEQQQLQGMEAQRQQKLSAFDNLFTKIAQNRKLNREGDLLLQMFPNFDQTGRYNGNQRLLYPGTTSTQGNGSASSVQNLQSIMKGFSNLPPAQQAALAKFIARGQAKGQ